MNLKHNNNQKDHIVTKEYHDLVHYQVAFEAIYGYRNGYCENNCFDRRMKELVLGSEYF